MSRTFISACLCALLGFLSAWLGGVESAFADDAIGILESVRPGGEGGVETWRIDGNDYLFAPDQASAKAEAVSSHVPGRLVGVRYEVRDGVRYATVIQPFPYGPDAIQDGPHLIWKDATTATMITVVDGEVIRAEFKDVSRGDELPTPSRSVPMIRVGSPTEASPASWPDAERILAVSDLEGNRETFLAFLKGNGVVNDRGDWIWGDGHLVLNGDLVDRGDEVTELLWLVRRLERQARASGGRVHYVLGNHESMVLAGDLRYIHPNYRYSTDRIGISYDALHGPDTELGRWLRNHNSVVRLGPLLFVHAGYSPELYRLGLELDEINETIRTGLGPPAWPAEARADLRTGLIWHQQGPHWYRGYFPQHAENWGGRPDDAALQAILDRHDADHVVVGHTVVEGVGIIDGRPQLIGIDVAWRDPSEAEGLLYEDGRLHRVDAGGLRTLLELPPASMTTE